MDTPQPLWAICFTVWPLLSQKSFSRHLKETSCISICVLCLILSLGTRRNRTGSALSGLWYQVFIDIYSPWAFSPPCYRASCVSIFHVRDAPVPDQSQLCENELSMSVCYWGAQSKAQHPTCPTSTEEKQNPLPHPSNNASLLPPLVSCVLS